MPLPFSLPQRPSLPSLTWSVGSPNNSADNSKIDDKAPKSAPPRTSQSSSSVASSIRRLSGSRSIRHTSIIVSRPTTPANPSPLSSAFGLPGDEDDPFGVLALQKAGLQIKEAGTNNRPGSEAFQYRPAPSSPIWRSSMASAMSRASRPSFDGRSSIMTGRAAHSRHGSTGTIATVATADMSTQTLDHDSTDQLSLREMSPVRESSHSQQTSPKGVSSRSPDSTRKSFLAKPDCLLLNDHELKLRDETPSPRSRLAVVDEDAQEDGKKDEDKEEKISARASTQEPQQDIESDLDRLARELREMADEHEQETRRSREEDKAKRNDSLADAETLTGEEEVDETKTPQRLSVKPTIVDDNLEDRSTDPIPVHVEEFKPSQEGINTVSVTAADEDEDEDGEDSEDDDDDADYDSFDDEEEAVIIEQAVQTAAPVNLRPRNLAAASLQARAQIVSVHLPPPPKIPSRNPRRTRQFDSADIESSDIQEEDNDEYSPSSSHDNDSTSTYSLERDRDSFDDGQDIMTQTSQGSDAGSTEVTPTRSKAFSSLSSQVERSLSDKIQSLTSDDSEEESHLPSAVTVKSPASDKTENQKTIAPESQELEEAPSSSLLGPPVPKIPERRRPFSFEATTSEEDLSVSSLDAVVENKAKESIGSGRATPLELKQTSGEPIRIPKLPEDDHSVYEEDFS